ncbi:MAG: TolC family protein [Rhizonema sp. PD38]|nr:TolC family protein [Rhizonema sp. PD38]
MMQLRYFYILCLLLLSLLSGCAQQKKTANVLTSPKDPGTLQKIQPDGISELPTPPPQQLGNQPQQNAQESKIPEFPFSTSPPQQLESQPQQNAQEGKISKSTTDPAPVALTNKQSQQMGFNINSAIVEPLANIKSTQRVQASRQNHPEQKQSTEQKLLNNRIPNQVLKPPTNANFVFRLSLSEAFKRADEKNPVLLAAHRNLDISAAGITIAGVRPNPQLAFQCGFGKVYTVGANPEQVGITQNFEMGGKRSKRISLAKSQYQLTFLQYNSARFDLHGQVRRAYAELAAAEASFRSQQEQIELLERLVYIARKRFEAGAAPEAELLQAQLVLNQTEPQLRQALLRIQEARIQLNALMGDNPNQNVEIDDPGIFNVVTKAVKVVKKTELVPTPDVRLPTINELLARAYEERLDLKAAQQQTAVAQRQLRLAKAQRIPDLQLSGGYLFTTVDPPMKNTNGVYFGAAVNLPIFYNQQGEVAQAKASLDQSQQQENVVQSQIAVDVRAAYQSLLIARETIRKYQSRLLPDSREVLGLAQESYQVGKTNLASAIAVEQADQQNRSAYVDAVTAYQSAYADLEKAVGNQLSF